MHKRRSTFPAPVKPTFMQVLQNQSQAPFTLDDFSAFLEQTHCLENLTFWLAVRHYKYYAYTYLGPGQGTNVTADVDDLNNTNFAMSLENLDDDLTLVDGATEFAFTRREERVLDCEHLAHFAILQEKMHFIVKTYIATDSPREINIPNTIRRQLLRQVTELGNYHPAVLAPPRDMVYELMRVNSYLPWLQDRCGSKMSQHLDTTEPPVIGRRTSNRHSWAHFVYPDSSSPAAAEAVSSRSSSTTSSATSTLSGHDGNWDSARSMSAFRKRLSNPFGKWMGHPIVAQSHNPNDNHISLSKSWSPPMAVEDRLKNGGYF
ncbi:RGS domain-containing protein [Jimgerdemannia flammicorona]|uniref:RGS domain-containing protein n=2 Tax=Jimgerdemannia flammicorona TaxID=994334 RepID=A0A433Q7S2_9FUNG|nr:RGS domain-containing protein [Jimgerdemannia flammicorona]RUS25834.1 RGS domain-containing protein [Jimgerdemannia flammicorona]